MDTRYEDDDRLELWLGAAGTSGPIGLAGRALLFGLLALLTAGFLRSGLDAEHLGGSFLHLVNLPFHEAGHVLFSPFGQFMMTLGGSLLQVAVPIVCAVVFLTKTRDPFAASAAAWWAGQNLWISHPTSPTRGRCNSSCSAATPAPKSKGTTGSTCCRRWDGSTATLRSDRRHLPSAPG